MCNHFASSLPCRTALYENIGVLWIGVFQLVKVMLGQSVQRAIGLRLWDTSYKNRSEAYKYYPVEKYTPNAALLNLSATSHYKYIHVWA